MITGGRQYVEDQLVGRDLPYFRFPGLVRNTDMGFLFFDDAPFDNVWGIAFHQSVHQTAGSDQTDLLSLIHIYIAAVARFPLFAGRSVL